MNLEIKKSFLFSYGCGIFHYLWLDVQPVFPDCGAGQKHKTAPLGAALCEKYASIALFKSASSYQFEMVKPFSCINP
jgi:hypothetical protein